MLNMQHEGEERFMEEGETAIKIERKEKGRKEMETGEQHKKGEGRMSYKT